MWRSWRTVSSSRPTAWRKCVALQLSKQTMPSAITQQHIFSSLRRPASAPVAVAGIALQDLAAQSRRELEAHFGSDQLRKVASELPHTWKKLMSDEQTLRKETIQQVFKAAAKCQKHQIMMDVFEYMDKHYPMHVDFIMYGEMFTLLTKQGRAQEIATIYERMRERFDANRDRAMPEIVYRFGVYASLGQQDFEAVDELLEEMRVRGIELSNELITRMMVANAKAGRKQQVIELFAPLNADRGRWHEADVDRVITALGAIQRVDDAFAFYRNASMQLRGNTLLTLLRVCRDNNRVKEAMAILANRKRFNLVLQTREYNGVMEILESLGEDQEVALILEEMQQKGVRADKVTQTIRARNERELARVKETTAGSSSSVVTKKPLQAKRAIPSDAVKLEQLLQRNAVSEAVALANSFITPMAQEDLPDGSTLTIKHNAMKIPAVIAKDAVTACALHGDDQTVFQLLAGFQTIKGDIMPALSAVISLYSNAPGKKRMVYEAFKAIQFQGYDIFRIKDAFELFLEFEDVEAALQLFHQILGQASAPEPLNFDRAHAIRTVLMILVNASQWKQIPVVFDLLQQNDIPVRETDYLAVFRRMQELNHLLQQQQKQKKPPHPIADAKAFDLIWNDMLRRGIEASKPLVGFTCAGFATSSSRNVRLKALTAYSQAIQNDQRQYSLPPVCYNALLSVATRDATLAELQSVYADGVRTLKEAGREQIPRDWVTMLVGKLAEESNASAAYDRFIEMKALCGGYSYDGLIAALRSCAEAQNEEKVDRLLGLFRQLKFRLSLHHAEELIQLAKNNGSRGLASQVIELFEQGNVVVRMNKAGEQSVGLQTPPSARVVDRLVDMYGKALALDEAQGDWKSAVVLKTRIDAFNALK